MALWDAARIFFATLFDRQVAEAVRSLLRGERSQLKHEPVSPPEQAPVSPPATLPTARKREKPVKSEAMILLEMLQREARFVDFIKEDLTNYSDAQIGAAVRDIHRDCAAVLERVFAIRPLVSASEGTSFELPQDFDSSRFRVVGNVVGSPPYRGTLVHHGWEATTYQLPVWQGGESAVTVIAPAEIEVSGS
ncbi:MAG: DUF2760 domain-containing protein [Thermogutta sp.]